jgi:hypothetical protein
MGGIHPPQDDIPGRKIGAKIGQSSVDLAKEYFHTRNTAAAGAGITVPALYPNPLKAGSELTVSGIHTGREFRLFDLHGRQVPLDMRSSGNGTIMLRPATSTPGLYILHSEGHAWKLYVE